MAAIDISAVLASPALRLLLIYIPNFAWFFAGFIQFSLRSHRWRGAMAPLHRRQTPRIGDAYHQDLLIYLGAFGGAVSLSVLDAAYHDLIGRGTTTSLVLPMYLRLWGVAHASQGLTGWTRIRPSARWDWKGYLGPITYTDTVLTLWDLTLAFW